MLLLTFFHHALTSDFWLGDNSNGGGDDNTGGDDNKVDIYSNK